MAQVIQLSSRNDGRLRGTAGDDLLRGSPRRPRVSNGRRGVIHLLAGNDAIISSRSISLKGVVTLKDGDDVIRSSGSIAFLGAYEGNSGNARISLGAGNDRVESRAEIDSSAADLSTGEGDDWILAQACIHLSYGTTGLGSEADTIIAGGTALKAIETFLFTGEGAV